MSTDLSRLKPEKRTNPKPAPQVKERTAAHAELAAAGFRASYRNGVHSIHTLDGRLFIESLSFAGAMRAFRDNVPHIRRAA